MRSRFITIFLLVTLLNLYAWRMLPESVASHFGRHGEPNGWSGKDIHFLVLQGLFIFLFLMFYYMPDLILKTPVRWVNIPHRGYWLRPENRTMFRKKISEAMYEMGFFLFLFFGFLVYLTMKANLSSPVILDERTFMTVFCFYLASVVVWLVKFYRSFRIPDNDNRRQDSTQ
jgi:uncharacterized membrane protein